MKTPCTLINHDVGRAACPRSSSTSPQAQPPAKAVSPYGCRPQILSDSGSLHRAITTSISPSMAAAQLPLYQPFPKVTPAEGVQPLVRSPRASPTACGAFGAAGDSEAHERLQNQNRHHETPNIADAKCTDKLPERRVDSERGDCLKPTEWKISCRLTNIILRSLIRVHEILPT